MSVAQNIHRWNKLERRRYLYQTYVILDKQYRLRLFWKLLVLISYFHLNNWNYRSECFVAYEWNICRVFDQRKRDIYEKRSWSNSLLTDSYRRSLVDRQIKIRKMKLHSGARWSRLNKRRSQPIRCFIVGRESQPRETQYA